MILDKLRKEMKKFGVDYYIVPTLDPHSCEYLPDYFKEREFITGFTGSAGTAVIGDDFAYLWTDGRYYIQAQKQIKDFGFSLMKQGQEGVLNFDKWIVENIKDGQSLAFNDLYFLQSTYEKLEEALKKKNVKIKSCDLIKDLWENRPEFPRAKAFIFEEKYAGESFEDKLKRIRQKLNDKKADMTVITNLEDICWALNIRGEDILYTPVVLSYLIIEENKATLFLQKEKAKDIKESLKNFVQIKEYDDFYRELEKYKNKNIFIDKDRVNRRVFKSLEDNNKFIFGTNITNDLKAIKNPIELENQRQTYIRDGVALTKYIYWLKNKVKDEEIGEYDAQLQLDKFRAEEDLYFSNSFETISAYGSNAAMMHYSAHKDKQSPLKAKGFYLVDSGGQYYTGTTDVTRTIALGKLNKEEITDFTLTLKCHLDLMDAIFLKGTTDLGLDAICRYPLWQNHMDYKCGTGHGVGYFLSVHEGPQRISPNTSVHEMKVGMIVSNEPGVYKENKHGIRIENIMEVIEDGKYNDGTFYKFNTMSLCPIECEAIDVKLLTDRELEVINEYHKRVYEKLSPFLQEPVKEWLKEVTKELER